MTARIRLPSIRNSKPLILRNGSWSLNQLFSDIAQTTSREVGRAWVFALAVATIVVWAVTGPLFHFSDTWQLVINTGTTIITFLMVFLIQNSQNRDARAINLKLNELIRSIDKARDQMIDIENLSDLELGELHAKYEKIKALSMNRRTRQPGDPPAE